MTEPPLEFNLLRLRVARCARCSDLDTTGWAFPPEYRERPILFLGESPGATEAKKHYPFVGPAGKLLRQLIDQAGLKQESLYITNIVKCFAADKAILGFEHVWNCLELFQAELALVRPRRIICLGRFAWEGLGCGRYRGLLEDLRQRWQYTKFQSEAFDELVPTAFMYHPAAALRHSNYLNALVEDFQWLTNELRT